ncbi:MAG: hypothetical protein ABJM29_13020 [Rhizobiaceae bacterium]
MSNEYVTDFILYRRKDSPNYCMRFTVRGHGQVRMSLQTDDPVEAERKARREHLRYQIRAEDGTYSPPKRFAAVADEYIRELEKRVRLGLIKPYRATNEPAIISRYISGYFGNHQIDTITEAMVQQFISWRFSYWVDGPGKDIEKIEYRRGGLRLFNRARHTIASTSTVRGNCAVLNNVFKFASANGYIRSGDIPRIKMPPQKPNPRPSFNLTEINQLFFVAEQRIADVPKHAKIRHERLMVYCYVNIAAYTGLRPVELGNLRWKHIIGFKEQRHLPLKDREILIYAFGKTQPREVVPMEHARSSFDLLWDAFIKVENREPYDDDPVFFNYYGKSVRSFKRSLNSLLEAANLKTHKFGGVRVAYSFRHFYISQQLIAGVGVFQIAKNAGTSVEMVEKFYARLGPSVFRDELRAKWSS